MMGSALWRSGRSSSSWRRSRYSSSMAFTYTSIVSAVVQWFLLQVVDVTFTGEVEAGMALIVLALVDYLLWQEFSLV